VEKTISLEERMKRAEEIYYRRKSNNSNIRMPSSQVTENVEKKQFSLYRKMILQILICVLIYLIFSLIKETNYLFSENVVSKTKEFLSTDINFYAISEHVEKFFWTSGQNINAWLNSNKENNQEENQKIEGNVIQNQENSIVQNEQLNNQEQKEQINSEVRNEQSNNVVTQNVENQTNINNENESKQNTEQISKNNQEIGIGGSNSSEEVVATSSSEKNQKTQMEKDAEYIKNNFKLQIPVKGEITSHYGKREKTEIISENHRGIDIGVVVGTTIVSAMDGIVSVVSNEGDYGTHVKIINKDITTVYAHCSRILVKEGDTVKKGQKIALSGNTGNTTGPHLHFEIQRSERTVDPELILNWQ